MSNTGLSQCLLSTPSAHPCSRLLAFTWPQHIPGDCGPNSSLSVLETSPTEVPRGFDIKYTLWMESWGCTKMLRGSPWLHELLTPLLLHSASSPCWLPGPSFLAPASIRALCTVDSGISTIPKHTVLCAFTPTMPCQDYLSSARPGPR